MDAELSQRIEQALGRTPTGAAPLPGGCIGEVVKLAFADGGAPAVAKCARGGGLALEGYMLQVLNDRSELPVPQVLYGDDTLLLMTFIDGHGPLNAAAQRDAADHVARLHAVRGVAFGLERDTLIGPLHQPNPQTERWLDFFRDHRLRYMADVALDRGSLTSQQRDRIERFAGKLGRYLDEPAHPALLHGDMWGGNVLPKGDRIAGFIDPAVYYGHPEIELAFATLFGTFGQPFFERYAERAPFEPGGFFEARRDVYNLYPLLVHAAAFGPGWAEQAMQTIDRLL
ncbi:fructosamine kinase [Rhodovibrio sodomensis]|uniref:Fructosamine kinase n=1 Tax=Rhodovibrio sodomensis TaxID=1088 RepID=A0ABS1DDL0_9PROT|nr:fructosamine kinase [Rhodovibrio sodomensis]